MRSIVIPDLFRGQAYSALTLTGLINNVPYVPGFLGSLGNRLFASLPISTKEITVEQIDGSIKVLATSKRGGPAQQGTRPQRQMRRPVELVHIKKEREVTADQIQDALNYAEASGQAEIATLQGLLKQDMDGPFGMRAEFELTHEYHRLGGIAGKVLDADGTVLYDWYQYFNQAPPADVVFDFGGFTAAENLFEVECVNLKRSVTRELQGMPATNAGIMVLCGDNYFDRVYSNKEVTSWRKNSEVSKEAKVFTGNLAFESVRYGGIDWINYRGSDDGQVGIGMDEARLVPVDVPGLFAQHFGPPDIMGLTNAPGVPVFSFMPPERQTSRIAVQEAQTNFITVCARPKALRHLKLATPST